MNRKPKQPPPPTDLDDYKARRIQELEEQKRRDSGRSKPTGWENCT